MLDSKSESIKRNLETLSGSNLQHIYRKNNLITHIEVEDDFQFNLYQNVKYSTTELLHLIKNLVKRKKSIMVVNHILLVMNIFNQKIHIKKIKLLHKNLKMILIILIKIFLMV